MKCYPVTPWSKYMAQSLKGRLIQGLYKPIHGNCAIYFYPGVHRDYNTPLKRIPIFRNQQPNGKCFRGVLRLLSVCSKRFLTNKARVPLWLPLLLQKDGFHGSVGFQRCEQQMLARWWQLKYFLIFTRKLGKIRILTFDEYFSDGLVQPPTRWAFGFNTPGPWKI